MRTNGKLKYSLKTFDQIVDALGGVKETARICRRTSSQVCQWRRRHGGRFPAEQWPNISEALLHRGYGTTLEMFTFDRRKG